MTVKELREKLAKLDDKARVVVRWDNEGGLNLFEIDDVSLSRGTPTRTKGKAGFKFQSTGIAEWAFVSINQA
jgi:hypothetical protein